MQNPTLQDINVVVVAGMGEVGRPLFNILQKHFDCVGVDVGPVDLLGRCAVMHVCYPFQIDDFIGTTVGYIIKYRPKLVIINSTVAPGTTRTIAGLTRGTEVAFSPVRGKHARMEADMLRYRKFVAGCTVAATQAALQHFNAAGLDTATFRTPEIAELSKLVETTAFGVLIGWAQEVERLAAQYDAGFDEVNSFIKEIDFLPSHIFPGHIGGHCVMPNIAILKTRLQSLFVDAVIESNKLKEPLRAGSEAQGRTAA